MVLRYHRVVAADAFNEAAIARTARVSDDDAIEGPLFGAAPRQANFDGHESSSLLISRSRFESARTQCGEPVPQQALLPELGHLLHHPAHLLVLFQELVDVLNRGAGTAGDAPPP